MINADTSYAAMHLASQYSIGVDVAGGRKRFACSAGSRQVGLIGKLPLISQSNTARPRYAHYYI